MRIFENLTVCLSDCAPGVLNRRTGQVEFRAATPKPAPVTPVAKPKPARVAPPPPTTEQRLAALATEVYRAPRVAALQATDPPHDRLSANTIYDYRRQQLQKRDFAVDAPSPAGSGELGRLAESIYQERARACGMY